MSTITELLAETKAIVEAATPGPWGFDSCGDVYPESPGLFEVEADKKLIFHGGFGDSPGIGSTTYWAEGNPNAAFIAHARTMLPALIEALELAVEQIQENIEEDADNCGHNFSALENMARILRKAGDR